MAAAASINCATTMSPSLTSGCFSGSNGDCKSTETSSILSANSYSSSSNPLLTQGGWNTFSSFSVSEVAAGAAGGVAAKFRPRFPLSEAHQFPYAAEAQQQQDLELNSRVEVMRQQQQNVFVSDSRFFVLCNPRETLEALLQQRQRRNNEDNPSPNIF